MITKNEKKTRVRRTQIAIDRDVLSAVNSLVEEVGFEKITLTSIAQKAKIESTVFYRRYDSLEDLFDRYTEKYDFWFNSIAENIPKDISDKEIFSELLSNLIKSLYKSKGMQQLLIWELSSDNKTTRKTARMREMLNEPLVSMLEARFAGSGVNIKVVAAIVISGIYYLILHRKRSTFCAVDFSTKIGKNQLESTVIQIIELLYSLTEVTNNKMEIAKRLREEGVNEEIIKRCVI